MADTNAFVKELDEHIGSIRTSMSALDETITARAAKLKTLESRRREIIHSTVIILLPNLEVATIALLSQKLPGFITIEQVQQQTVEMEGTHRSRLENLSARLATYDSDLAKVQVDLSEARSDLSTLESAFTGLAEDVDMAVLVKHGYSTERYRPKWHDMLSLDFTFFKHWKKADELVAFYNAKDFNQLMQQYMGQTAALSAVKTAEARLRDLRSVKATYDDVVKALNAVPKAVLDRIQSKLKAYLDTLSPVPDWMSDLVNVDSRVAALVTEQRADQDAHASISTDFTKLAGLKTKISRSGKREVPDQYVEALRSSRVPVQNGTTVHVHNGGGFSGGSFFGGVLWGQMDSYFAQDLAYERGRRDASYNPGYGGGASPNYGHVSSPSWQQADNSGQS